VESSILSIRGVFEPIVMFFVRTSSLVTFQVMINDLLRNMIKIEDAVAFIDDVMVGTETEKKHDNTVEKY